MFDKLIGQSALKRKLKFFAETYQATHITPNLLFEGAKGNGKTAFAKEFAKALKKPMLEINCSTIKNAKNFFEQVFIPVVMDNEITILFDEAHKLPMDLQNIFLTVFNVEDKVKRKTIQVNDATLEFNFEQQSFIFATTEGDKIFHPLKERFTTVDFEPYTTDELKQIMVKQLDWVTFGDDVMDLISETLRGNPRSAVKRGKDIAMFCEKNNQSTFNGKNWRSLCHSIGIRPLGLSNNEIEVLKILHERGACTLNALAAITGQARQALQRDIEFYLLRKDLIKIEGTRRITVKGTQILASM